jgi:hypothetical protein
LDEVHALHALKDSEEFVFRGACHLTEPREGQFAIPLQLLSHTELTDSPGFTSRDDVAAVGAEKIALIVISGYLLAATYRTGCLRESQ